jgi:hypothetical protein
VVSTRVRGCCGVHEVVGGWWGVWVDWWVGGMFPITREQDSQPAKILRENISQRGGGAPRPNMNLTASQNPYIIEQ